MAELNETSMAGLAREMAMNIRPYKAVFADYSISEEEYYEICKHEFYQKAKEQYALAWNSTASAADRIKLISAAYAEQGLPVVTRTMLAPGTHPTVVLDTFKQLCKNAGLGENKPNPSGESERFVITINLGGDIEKHNKSIEVNPQDVDLGMITVDK
jgi:hypothetical protein